MYEPSIGTIPEDLADAAGANDAVSSVGGPGVANAGEILDEEFVPYFQRVSISGDDNTGVSSRVFVARVHRSATFVTCNICCIQQLGMNLCLKIISFS